MPIIVYKADNERKQVAWLCDGEWELPFLIDALEKWLVENENNFDQSSYIADIGFIVRKDACGGGSVIGTRMMGIMLNIGMELLLSEYPDE